MQYERAQLPLLVRRMQEKRRFAFQTHYKPDRLLLVGDTGLPWEEFLALEPDGLF